MRIALCTLALNEMEWLPKLVEQHKDWPGLCAWVFVEATDQCYADANPDRVGQLGLSIDGTSDFLRDLNRRKDWVKYLPLGLVGSSKDANGKVRARDAYMRVLEEVKPDLFVILDADEFYTKDHQKRICEALPKAGVWDDHLGFALPFLHPWRPPSIAHRPLFQLQAVGGFFAMPHCHVWRWEPGMGYYGTHVNPGFADKPAPWVRVFGRGHCIHMAFSSTLASRQAKHRYYKERGEDQDLKRSWYCVTRACFEDWEEGDVLPKGAKIVPWTGAVPECFQ